jgi:hypothetical protein
LALDCCASNGNSAPAEEAAVVAYERVTGPDGRKTPRNWTDQHRRPEIGNEIMKQMRLLMCIRPMATMDDRTAEALRRSAM